MRAAYSSVGGNTLLDIHRCSINICKVSAACNYNENQWLANSGTRTPAFQQFPMSLLKYDPQIKLLEIIQDHNKKQNKTSERSALESDKPEFESQCSHLLAV